MASRKDIADFYIAVLGRAPDREGLDYWHAQVESGALTLRAMCANWMFEQPEVVERYAGVDSDVEFVTLVYRNVLARQPDAGGLEYWVGELGSGAVTRDGFIAELVFSVRSQSSGVDVAVLEHRAQAGLLAADAGVVEGAFAQQIITMVTADPSTLEIASSLIRILADHPETRDAVGEVLTELSALLDAGGRPTVVANLAQVFSGLADGLERLPERAMSALEAADLMVAAAAISAAFVNDPPQRVRELLQNPEQLEQEALEVLYPSPEPNPVPNFAYQLIAKGDGFLLRLEGSGNRPVEVDLSTNEAWLAGNALVLAGAPDLVDVQAGAYSGLVIVTGTVAELLGPDATLTGVDVRHLRDGGEALAAVDGPTLATITNIHLVGTATVAQAQFVAGAANLGSTVIDALADSAAQLVLLSDATLGLVAGSVTATEAATVAQAVVLQGFAGDVAYSIEDTATALAAASGAVLEAAVDLTATGVATVAEATVIAAAGNGGVTSIAALQDTAAALAGSSDTVLGLVLPGAIEASTAATATEAEALAGFDAAIVFDLSDTAASVAGLASGVLAEARDITITDTATLAQAAVAAAAGNAGATTIVALEDLSAHLVEATDAVLSLVSGTVTALDAATVAQATVLEAFVHAVVYSIEDTVAALAAANPAVLDASVDLTATGAANVAQATAIASATNSGITSIEALQDTAAALAGSNDAVLGLVVDGSIEATTAAAAAQAEALAGFEAAIVFDISDTAALVVALAPTVLAEARDITITDAVTVAQAATLAAAGNTGTTTIVAMEDSSANLAGTTDAVLSLVSGLVTATDAATVVQATVLEAFTHAVVYSVEDTAAALAAASPAVLDAAVDLTATGTATVAQATAIASATNSGTTSIEELQDTAASLSASTDAVLNLVSGTVTATDAATIAQATVLEAFTHAVVYSVEDTAVALAAASPAVLDAAVDLTATGVATVAQATAIASATNSGTTSIEELQDTAAELAGSSDEVLGLVVDGEVEATTAATASEAAALAGFDAAIVFDIEDTAALVAALDPTVLAEARDISITGTATVAQAAVAVGAGNSGTTAIAALEDTSAHLAEATDAVLNLVSGLVTATDAATVAQATVLEAFTHAVVYSIEDTAAALAAASPAVLDAAVDLTATGTATVAQATVIAAATNSGTTSIGALQDTAAALAGSGDEVLGLVTSGAIEATTAAAAVQAEALAGLDAAIVFDIEDTAALVAALAPTVLAEARDITITDSATVTQAATLAAASNTGTTMIAEVEDTSANLAAATDVVLSLVSGLVTATDAATVAQATVLEAFTHAVVYSVEDTAAALAVASPAVLDAAVDLTATGTATLAQATVIAAATNSGTTSIAALQDTAAALAGSSDAVLGLVVDGEIEASTVATAIEAAAIAGFDTAIVFDIEDTAALVAELVPAVLAEARDITITDAATVAQAATLAAAGNTGTTTIAALEDTAANLVASTDAVLNLVSGSVTATDAATVAQATVLEAFTHAVVYSVEDTAAALAAASPAVLDAAVDLTATGTATVAQATAIASATNSGTTSIEELQDTAAALAGSNDAVLGLVVEGAIEATTVATAAQAEVLAGFDTVIVFDIEDSATLVAALASTVLAEARDITITDSATVTQAATLAAAGNTGTTTIAALEDTAANLVASTDAVLNLVSGSVTATDAATVAQATVLDAFTHAVVYSIEDTAAALASAGPTVLDAAVDLTATGTATVEQATVIAAATNTGTTSIGALQDTAAALAGSSDAVLGLVGDGEIEATTAATATEAAVIAGFDTAIVFDIEDTAVLVAALAPTVLAEARDITITDAATVAQAAALAAVGNTGTTAIAEVEDTSANLAGTTDAVLNLVSGLVTAKDAATVAQATVLEAFIHTVVYSIEDTVTALVAANSAVLDAAVDLTATGTATVAQATAIAVALNSGATSIGALQDTAAALAGSSDAVLGLVTTGAVEATTAATATEAAAIAGFDTGIVFDIEDTAVLVAALAPTILSEARHITITDAATVAQVVAVANAGNFGLTTIAALEDTSAHLVEATDAVLNLVSGLVTATDAATVAQATVLESFVHAVVYSIEDTVEALAGAGSAVLDAAVDLTATGIANLEQAAKIEAATNEGETTIEALQDTAAALAGSSDAVLGLVADGGVEATTAATAAEAVTLAGFETAIVFDIEDTTALVAALDSMILAEARHITVTDAATVAQVVAVANADNSGLTTIAALEDTSAHLAEATDAVLNLVSGSVTATDAATVAQATVLEAFTHAVVYSIEDTAAALAAASPAVLDAAVNLTATGTATVAQAAVIAAALNSGTSSIAALQDTATALAGSSEEVLGLVVDGAIEATTAATAAQAEALAGFDTAIVFDIEDTAALVVALAPTVLAEARDVTITDAATVAQAATLAAAGNTGTTTIVAMEDSSANLSASTDAVLNLVSGTVTATDAATVAQATVLEAFTHAVLYSIEDTAAAMAAATAATLNAAGDLTVTGIANVEQATTIAAATNSGTTTITALQDTAAALAGSSDEVLELVSLGAIEATTTATAAEAEVLAGFAALVLFDVADTAENIAALSVSVLSWAGTVTLTTAATVAQASAILGFGLGIGYGLEDEVEHYFTEDGEDVVTVVQPGVAVTVSDAASVLQLDLLDDANGEDAGVSYGALVDSAASLWNGITVSDWVADGIVVTITGAVTVGGLRTIDAANGAASVGYSALEDGVDAFFQTVGEDATVVAEVADGIDVIVVDPATLAQLAALDAANGSGTLSYAFVTDTAQNLLAGDAYLSSGITIAVTDDDAGLLTTTQYLALLDVTTEDGWAYSLWDTLESLLAMGEDVLAGATDLHASGTASVVQATELAMAGNGGTTTIEALADTVEALLASSDEVLNLVTGPLNATTAASAGQAELLLDFEANVLFDIRDTAEQVASLERGVAAAAASVILTNGATVTQATTILGFDLGITYALVDEAANYFVDGEDVAAVVRPGVGAVITDAASVAELRAIDAANGGAAVLYSALEDSVSAFFQALGEHTSVVAEVIPDVDVTLTDAASVWEVAVLDAANGNGSVQYGALADTTANLFELGGEDVVTSVVAGIHLTVLDAVTLAQLQALDDTLGTDGLLSYGTIADSAANLLAGSAYLASATAVAVAGGHAGSLTAAQYLQLLAITTNDTWTYDLSDTLAALLAAAPDVLVGARDLHASGTATVAQAGTLEQAGNSGTTTLESLADTAANVAGSSAEVLGLVSGDITLTNAATVAQADQILGLGLGIAYSLEDETDHYFVDNHVVAAVQPGVTVSVTTALGRGQLEALDAANGAAPVHYHALSDQVTAFFTYPHGTIEVIAAVKDGTDVNLRGYATLEQLGLLDAANGNGALTYEAIMDTASNLLSGSAYLAAAPVVVLTGLTAGTVTVAQVVALDEIVTWTGWSYNLQDDIATLAVAEAGLLADASFVLATGSASVHQATALADARLANPAGTTTIAVLADTAANIAGSSTAVLGLVSGSITVTDAATVAQVTAILLLVDSPPLTVTTLEDTAANLLQADDWVHDLAVVRVAGSDAGTLLVAEYGTLLGITTADDWSYALSDSIANLTGAAGQAAIGDGVAIHVTDAVTLAQLAQLDALNGSASVTADHIVDTAANLLADTRYVAAAGTVLVADGDAGGLSMAQVGNLAALTTSDDWSYELHDTAQTLMTTEWGLIVARASSVLVTGTTTGGYAGWLSVNVNKPIQFLAVTDSVAMLLSVPGAVLNQVINAVTATGTATASQAAGLAAFQKPVVYTVEDTASNLLAYAGEDALTEASVVRMSGEDAGELSVAQWQALDAMNLDEPWQYGIVDTFDQLFGEDAGQDWAWVLQPGTEAALQGQERVVVQAEAGFFLGDRQYAVRDDLHFVYRGTAAADAIYGGDRPETLEGGAGNDILNGGGGENYLYGGAGDDVFEYDSLDILWNDGRIDGGDGWDSIRFTVPIVSSDVNGAFEQWGDHPQRISVEQIILSDGSAINIGGNVTAAGVERIVIGNGATSLRFDPGVGGPIVVDGSESGPASSLYLTSFWDTATNIRVENLVGTLNTTYSPETDFGDQLLGTLEVTVGPASTGRITTGASVDTIWAGDGSDVISTGSGSDWIYGGGGADTIDFGADGDSDIYAIGSASDGGGVLSSTGYDVLTNFNVADDRIQLSSDLLASLGNGATVQAASIGFDTKLDTTAGGLHESINVFVQTEFSLNAESLLNLNLVAFYGLGTGVSVDVGDQFLLVVNTPNGSGFGIYHVQANFAHQDQAPELPFGFLVSIIGIHSSESGNLFTTDNVDPTVFFF